jgi:hypothetical protein
MIKGLINYYRLPTTSYGQRRILLIERNVLLKKNSRTSNNQTKLNEIIKKLQESRPYINKFNRKNVNALNSNSNATRQTPNIGARKREYHNKVKNAATYGLQQYRNELERLRKGFNVYFVETGNKKSFNIS